jgi:hypothetical protein
LGSDSTTARPNRAEPMSVQETKKSHVVSGLLTKKSLPNFYGAEFDGQVRGAQRQRAARLIWISELARALSPVAPPRLGEPRCMMNYLALPIKPQLYGVSRHRH